MFNKVDDAQITSVFARINTNLLALITIAELKGVLPTDEQITQVIEVPIVDAFESQLKQSLDAISTRDTLNNEEKKADIIKQRRLFYKKMSYITHPDRINNDTVVFANTTAQAFKDNILKLATLLPPERREFLKTRAHTALESQKELPFCLELEISVSIEALKISYLEHHALFAEATQKDMEALWAYLDAESDPVLKKDILSLIAITLLAVRKKNAPDSAIEALDHLADIYSSFYKKCSDRLFLLRENHRILTLRGVLITGFCVMLVMFLYIYFPFPTVYIVTQMAILSAGIALVLIPARQHNDRVDIVTSFLKSTNSEILLCSLSHMKLLKKCPEVMKTILMCITKIKDMDKRTTILEDMIAILDWNPRTGTAFFNSIMQEYAEGDQDIYRSILLLITTALKHAVDDLSEESHLYPEESHLHLVPLYVN